MTTEKTKKSNVFDVIIIGGGPAGLTAALYARRAGKSVLNITGGSFGGAAATTPFVENFPGHPQIGGQELTDKIAEQVETLGALVSHSAAEEVKLKPKLKSIKTSTGETFSARNVIIATGSRVRKLGVPNEEKFTGRGVSYCAVCDGNFFRKKDVCVIGGGNTALTDALYLSALAKKVYLIHRRDEFRGSPSLSERVIKTENIELILNAEALNIEGDLSVKGVTVFDKTTSTPRLIDASGIFIAIGSLPNSELFPELKKDANAALITDKKMRTNINGVFAVGDVRNTPLKQIISACADGATAATYLL